MNLSAHVAHASARHQPLHCAVLPCNPPLPPAPFDSRRRPQADRAQGLRCPTRVRWEDIALDEVPRAEMASC